MAKVTFRLAAALSQHFGLGVCQDWLSMELEVAEDESLRRFLERLAGEDSRLDGRLYDRDAGKLGPEVTIVFNGRVLDRSDTSLDVALSPGDRVTVVPAPEG